MEGILGSASRIVQPPLSMRSSKPRKSRSQDTDNRRPIETALTTEGVHRDIPIDNNGQKIPAYTNAMAYSKPGLRGVTAIGRPLSPTKGPVTSSPLAPQPVGITDAKVIHETLANRPAASQPIAVPGAPVCSPPSTPVGIGKGHAHDPLQDTLFLNIGTGEDAAARDGDQPVVSESPSNADLNVYEAAYQEEIQRILKRKGDSGRRPTLYLTRRVEDVKSIRDNDAIYQSGKAVKNELRGLMKQAMKNVEEREGERKLEGKSESLLGRGLRNVKEFKDMVDEARDIVREEERRGGSQSSTPALGSKGSGSRSATPVAGEK